MLFLIMLNRHSFFTVTCC